MVRGADIKRGFPKLNRKRNQKREENTGRLYDCRQIAANDVLDEKASGRQIQADAQKKQNRLGAGHLQHLTLRAHIRIRCTCGKSSKTQHHLCQRQ